MKMGFLSLSERDDKTNFCQTLKNSRLRTDAPKKCATKGHRPSIFNMLIV